MCRFLSALGFRDSSIRWHWAIDSHSVLMEHFGIIDTRYYQTLLVKLELVPRSGADMLDPEKWEFLVDEQTAPVWCDDDRIAHFRSAMVAAAKSMIVTNGTVLHVYDRCLILGGTAKVEHLRGGARVQGVFDNATIRGVHDTSRISDVHGGTITGVYGGTITDMYGGTIRGVYGGTIWGVHGGTIDYVRDGTISGVLGGTISNVRGGTITGVHGGTITGVHGGTITNVSGGTITDVSGGTIDYVRGGELDKSAQRHVVQPATEATP